MNELKSYIRSLDAGRLVNYVSCNVHVDPGRDATGVGDMIMWNDYIGTWHGEYDLEEVIESIQRDYPDKPIVVSEYGLCEPAFAGGDPRRIEILREKTNIYRKYPGFAGLIFFSLNDYRTQMGEDGEGRMRQRVHGVTNLYREKLPSYEVLRDISSPVLMESVRRMSENSLACTIRIRDDIPSYTVSGYRLTVRQEGGSHPESVVLLPTLAPGASAELEVTGEAAAARTLTFEVFRPTGFSVMRTTLQVE